MLLLVGYGTLLPFRECCGLRSANMKMTLVLLALIAFELPAGHYQFFAGYGGGVHESKSIVSNPVSLDLRKDQAFPKTE